MPRVPSYDNFQVAPSSKPTPQLNATDAPDVAGRQFRAMGQGLQTMGVVGGQIVLDKQREADILRVDDALNRVKETALRLQHDKTNGFLAQRGIQALERASGKALADEYGEALDKDIGDAADSLGTERQRLAFRQRANDLLTGFKGQALAHESGQFREYALSVREGTIATRTREIGLNYNNPGAIDDAVLGIQASVADQARLLGKSAEWAQAQSQRLVSNAHKVALSAALENGTLEYAEGYIRKYKGQIDADDLLRVQALITKERDQKVALDVATEVVQKVVAPRAMPTEKDRAFNILLGAESNWKQFDASGKPTTSPKGAIGIAQVMPGTGPEAAKLAGLPWDENRYKNDAEYNKAIGRAYFEKQLKDFGGNLAFAYAAYNAGPGALGRALKEVEKEVKTGAFRGGPPSEDYWLSKMPKETRDYVTKNMKAYTEGGGKPERPTLMEAQNAVRERLGTSNPMRLKLALDETKRQFDAVNDGIKQREEEGMGKAYEALIANGGDFAGLPLSVRSRVPAGKTDDLLGFANRIRKGQEPETDWGLYYTLRTDPVLLAGTNLMSFRDRLSDGDFKALAGAQEQWKKDPERHMTRLRTLKEVINQFLLDANEQPTPEKGDLKARAKIGKVMERIETQIRDFERTKGAEATVDEQRKIAAQMFNSVEVKTWLGLSSEARPLALVKEGDKIVVPAADRALIVDALRKRNRAVDEKTIEAEYLTQMGLPKAKR